MAYFAYGEQETGYLQQADPALGEAIGRLGHIDRTVIPDLFQALVNSIAGQQISGKALETIWARICAAFDPLTPETILAGGAERLRSCGLSGRKAGYILSAAAAAQQGLLDSERIAGLSDEAIISHLTVLPGVGRWTAEMLLIFSLQRPDVMAFDDLGIRRGLCRLHGVRKLTRELFEQWRARYSPYGTVASLYLWALAAEK